MRVNCGHDLSDPKSYFLKVGTAGTKPYKACRRCRTERQKEYMKRKRKGIPSPLAVPLTEREYCVNGHKVTPDSIKTKYPPSRPNGYSICIECAKMSNRTSAKTYREKVVEKGRVYFYKYECALLCGHENYFTGAIPLVEDVVYCYRCRDYSAVLSRKRMSIEGQDPDARSVSFVL